MPMVGTSSLVVMAAASSVGMHSRTTEKHPASWSLRAWSKISSASAADFPSDRNPPRTLTLWGVSPVCPITAMPESTTPSPSINQSNWIGSDHHVIGTKTRDERSVLWLG